MKGIVYTYKGMEDIAAKEVKELIGKDSEIKEKIILFDCTKEDLCLLCYKGQSFIKVFGVVGESPADTFEDGIKKMDLSDWLSEDRTFAARAIVIEETEERLEIEGDIGASIIENEHLDFKPKVNLTSPGMTFVGIFGDIFYLCVDFAGADLSKREYRIYTHPSSIKATLAYAMLRIADLKQGELFIDPFCGSATIAIEAVHLLSKRSINFFNKDKFAFLKFMDYDFKDEVVDVKAKIHSYDNQMRHIKAAEKNAKIAGVQSMINFSRTEVEWLDTKFAKKTVDKIVTHPPQIGKFVNAKDLQNTYDELFYQVDYILKDEGRVVVLSLEGRGDDMFIAAADKKKIKLLETIKVFHGKQMEHILVFGR